MRRFLLAILLFVAVTTITGTAHALTAFDAVGSYRVEAGVYTPAQTPGSPDTPDGRTEPIFSERLAAVCVDGLWGYIGPDGRIVVNPQFTEAGRFSRGLAPVKIGEKHAYIDVTGAVALDASAYDAVYPFREDRARVEVAGRSGFIDLRGNLVIPTVYDAASDVSEGLIAARKAGKWGYLTAKGETAIAFRYDYAASFAKGVAYVELDGEGLLIDTEGDTVAQNVYSGLDPASNFVLARGEKGWGYVSAAGETVIECQWTDVELPSEGFIGVYADGLWGFMDYSGGIVIDPQWDAVWPFSGGFALVCTFAGDGQSADSYAFINRLGFTLSDETHADARPFSDGAAAVFDGTRWGYIDGGGDTLIDCAYDFAGDFQDGYAVVGSAGAFLIIDKAGTALTVFDAATTTTSTAAATTSATTTAARIEEPEETTDYARMILFTAVGMLVVYVLLSALLRGINSGRRRRAQRSRPLQDSRERTRYYPDED